MSSETPTAGPLRMPATVAVTGAMGFVASRLLPRLYERGVRVLALVRPGRETAALPASPLLEFREGDLAEPATLALVGKIRRPAPAPWGHELTAHRNACERTFDRSPVRP